jgi:hypothetical protein
MRGTAAKIRKATDELAALANGRPASLVLGQFEPDRAKINHLYLVHGFVAGN